MLTDYWVITQLLVQVFSWILLANALIFAVQFIRRWSIQKNDEQQMMLERKSYLIGFTVQFVLGFQFVSLFLFLHTVNIHLTKIIKGAMCATGVLGTNEWGDITLYAKIIAVLVYVIFLIINYLDNNEPAYPLTPIKYYALFPAFVILSLDTFFTYQFFSRIEPDIIATCCSVRFVTQENQAYFQVFEGKNWVDEMLIVWLILGGLLLISQWIIQKQILRLIPQIIFIFISVYVLKFFFVKYIYGLPAHSCLFDIFWAKYYYIGYLIFGSYAVILLVSLGRIFIQAFEAKLVYSYQNLLTKLRYIETIALLASMLVPLTYFWLWKGNL